MANSDELASYSSPVLATIDGHRWCFVFARGGLIGLDPALGKVNFHFPWRAESSKASTPATRWSSATAYFSPRCYGPGGALLEVKPGGCEGSLDRRQQGPRQIAAVPLEYADPRRGYVYGSSGRHTDEAELRCVELATGKVMWSEPGLTRSSLLLVDGHFVCLAEYGELLLMKVNPHKYEEVSGLQLEPRRQPGRKPVCCSIPAGRPRSCRTACSTSAARIGWCAWS